MTIHSAQAIVGTASPRKVITDAGYTFTNDDPRYRLVFINDNPIIVVVPRFVWNQGPIVVQQGGAGSVTIQAEPGVGISTQSSLVLSSKYSVGVLLPDIEQDQWIFVALGGSGGGGGGAAIEPETGTSGIKVSAFPDAPKTYMQSADRVTGLQDGANVNFSQADLLLTAPQTADYTQSVPLNIITGDTYGKYADTGGIKIYSGNQRAAFPFGANSGNITLYTGFTNGYFAGNIHLLTGDAGTGGNIILEVGPANYRQAGKIQLKGGFAQLGYDGGNIELTGGRTYGMSNHGGNIILTVGTGTPNGQIIVDGVVSGVPSASVAGGNLQLYGGPATAGIGNGGNVVIKSGTSVGGVGGQVHIASGIGSGAGAYIYINAADGSAGSNTGGGYVKIYGGNGDGSGNGGSSYLYGGDGGNNGGSAGLNGGRSTIAPNASSAFMEARGSHYNGNGGEINISGGTGYNGQGGNISIQVGGASGASGAAGRLFINLNTGVTGDGQMVVQHLPTADPTISDALWVDHGVIVQSGIANYTGVTTVAAIGAKSLTFVNGILVSIA